MCNTWGEDHLLDAQLRLFLWHLKIIVISYDSDAGPELKVYDIEQSVLKVGRIRYI